MLTTLGFEEITSMLRSGVYALCLGEEVIYVGQSKNVVARIAYHGKHGRVKIHNGKLVLLEFDRAWVKWCPERELNKVEYRMIRELSPKLNRQHNVGSFREVPKTIASLDLWNLLGLVRPFDRRG